MGVPVDLHSERPQDGGRSIDGGGDSDADGVRPRRPVDRGHDSGVKREVIDGCAVVVDQYPVADPEAVPLESRHDVARRVAVAARAREEMKAVICSAGMTLLSQQA